MGVRVSPGSVDAVSDGLCGLRLRCEGATRRSVPLDIQATVIVNHDVVAQSDRVRRTK